eukprot:TRINITY_DN45295_c0_g1_i2.p1 TRINITY_DN45295_c0_g1~~TRINITY_DN45295_c0_g1_i2.p1  ORF type:complete len:574 (-),score=128.07 TRINITY_DN45295_c0_g1_i2:96-1754(-)
MATATATSALASTLRRAVVGLPSGRRCVQARFQRAFSAEAASDALQRAAAAAAQGSPATASAATASQDFLGAHRAMPARDRAVWWAKHALADEEEQLEELSRALPRGGRVAPMLLDTIQPATLGALRLGQVEATVQGLVAALGAPAGLRGALELRAALREAIGTVGEHSPAGAALLRLDCRVQTILAAWFSPGLLKVDRIRSDDSPHLIDAAAHVAHAAAPELFESADAARSALDLDGRHRCFVLSHPQMSPAEGEAAPALMVAHASVLPGDVPGTLAEVVGSSAEATPAQASSACLWALGRSAGSDDHAAALDGLGLALDLRRRAALALAAEGNLPMTAIAPLHGLARYLRERGSWQAVSDPLTADVLRRHLEGVEATLHEFNRVEFVDTDGDAIAFEVDEMEGLLMVSLGEGSEPRHVSRLVLAEQGRALRFVMQPGDEAMQVLAPEEVASRGDLLKVGHLAQAAGLFEAAELLREPLMKLAYDYLGGLAPNSPAVENGVHFHLSGGATLRGLQMDTDLGISASFLYEGAESEAEKAEAYAQFGFRATMS